MKRYGALVGVWLWVVSAWAWAYFTSELATPPPDLYARSISFQLLMFALFRLPWLIALLVAALVVSRRPAAPR